ncbi:MAG: hypothetical protein H6713_15170 [Myxococcales bacterium]|nr:hypothetical protein [Myxococcales bacterium]
MIKELDAVLAAAVLTAATLAAPACGGNKDDGTDTDTETASGTNAGCPGATTGCPGTTNGCPGTTTGCPGATTGCPGATTGCPGATTGCPGATMGCPGATMGCPGATEGCPGTMTGCPGTGTGCGAVSVPTNGDELLPWLEGGNYLDWSAESGIHDATLNSPHGRVRVFINDALDGSLANADPAHPQGAAAVKELYDGGDNMIGWAVTVKTDADSMLGEGWYWFETISGNEVADGNGVALCTSCHAGGNDYFTTVYPLQ